MGTERVWGKLPPLTPWFRHHWSKNQKDKLENFLEISTPPQSFIHPVIQQVGTGSVPVF